jgi:hypothetical protein
LGQTSKQPVVKDKTVNRKANYKTTAQRRAELSQERDKQLIEAQRLLRSVSSARAQGNEAEVSRLWD